jgi:hypothetical protein
MNPIDDDAFVNFAAVVFAAAENHDFAYGKKTVTTDTTEEDNSVSQYKSSTSCLAIIKQFWGTTATSTIKKEPVLNLANSRLFKRRAEQRKIHDVA